VLSLDQTRIAIRERGFLEILDLALCVIRGQPVSILLAWAAGVLPCLALNYWLLVGPFQLGDALTVSGEDILAGDESIYQYIAVLSALILFEIPLATAPLTLYLGEFMFQSLPRSRKIAGSFLQALPKLCVYHLLARAILTVFCIVPVSLLYIFLPYVNEIVLLERNTWAKTRGRIMSYHGDNSGLIFSRFIGAFFFGVFLLVPSVWFSLLMIRNMFLAQWSWESLAWEYGLVVELPIALWLVAGYFTVVRFLSYLDFRIRREGWEVDLKLQAEAARLQQRMAG